MTTKIEWVQSADGTKGETWNPTRGCQVVSPGCKNCYAMRQAIRMSGPGKAYEGLVTLRSGKPAWTGKGRFAPGALEIPLRRRKPTMFFVDSMSDLFFEEFSDEQIDRVLGVMAASPRHTFQVLTKRPQRMLEWFGWMTPQRLLDGMNNSGVAELSARVGSLSVAGNPGSMMRSFGVPWPLPNLWLGVSVENQAAADERIPLLLQTPAAIRWVSAEPLLGPVDLGIEYLTERLGKYPFPQLIDLLDWVVVGGESGPGARPMDEDWVRSIRDQCQTAGVSFFYKQRLDGGRKVSIPELDGRRWREFPKVAE